MKTINNYQKFWNGSSRSPQLAAVTRLQCVSHERWGRRWKCESELNRGVWSLAGRAVSKNLVVEVVFMAEDLRDNPVITIQLYFSLSKASVSSYEKQKVSVGIVFVMLSDIYNKNQRSKQAFLVDVSYKATIAVESRRSTGTLKITQTANFYIMLLYTDNEVLYFCIFSHRHKTILL